jgi:hypothetical protein
MRSLFIALLILFTGSAQALVIDFEELAPTGGSTYEPISSGLVGIKEFTFTGLSESDQGGNLASGDLLGNGSTALYYCGACRMEMVHSQGDLFSLFSLDYFGAGAADITVTGFLSGGGTLQTTMSYLDGTPTNFVFDADWMLLEKVEFGMAPNEYGDTWATAIDNVAVAPIPAAVWLFGSALAGLGWFRRKTA